MTKQMDTPARKNSVRTFLLTLLAGLVILPGLASAGSSWPTLHNDYQRSGYTDEVLEGPFSRKWFRDFHDEMIATRVEAIVAEGKCFVGTFAGKFRGLDVVTGETVWEKQLAGPIGASPSYHDGLLYVGCDEAFNAGRLYAIRASDGEIVWEYPTGAGIWVAPSCDGEKVYVGDRGGMFHAVDAKSGEGLWTYETGDMILKPASFSKDGGKIIFGSEDMHVYCLNPAGELLWKTEKLPGLSLRDQGPTIWQDKVIVRTNPADEFHKVLSRHGDALQEIQRQIPLKAGEEPLLDKWGDYLVPPTPERRAAEEKGVVEYLKKHPYDRTTHTIDLATGEVLDPWPIFYTCGLHNPPTPPTFNPHSGDLYTITRTAMTYYLRGVRRYSGICRIKPDGEIDWYFPEKRHNERRMWYGIPLIGDETSAVSLMGNQLVVTHQGDLGRIDLEKEEAYRIWEGRDTYGGIFGYRIAGGWEDGRRMRREGWLVSTANEWHGPDRAIVAIAEGRLFWVVGSQVICLGGKDIPAGETGGTEAPEPIKNRMPLSSLSVKKLGMLEVEGVTRPTISDEAFRELAMAENPTYKQADCKLAEALRARLDAQVLELVEGGPWAPLAIQLGISGPQVYFRRTSETMEAVSLAMPHLSSEVAAKAKAYLNKLYRDGVPLMKPVWPGGEGKRREAYDLAPEISEVAARTLDYKTSVKDLYALYAYARATDNVEILRNHQADMNALFRRATQKSLEFEFDDLKSNAAQELNAITAGILAYARSMDALGEQQKVDEALKVLKPLMIERAYHEMSNRRLVRPEGGVLHTANTPRYRDLTPETAAIIDALAGEALRRNVNDLLTGLPIWHHAYGERMVGGENYISPPSLAHSIFIALADGVGAEPETLAAFVDQPWGKADLFYINKLAAALRQSDAPKTE